jgi:hypothetical protein
MPVLPPPVGGHWEAIGFQGLDPSTDLNRSMKMLTIVQVDICFREMDGQFLDLCTYLWSFAGLSHD